MKVDTKLVLAGYVASVIGAYFLGRGVSRTFWKGFYEDAKTLYAAYQDETAFGSVLLNKVLQEAPYVLNEPEIQKAMNDLRFGYTVRNGYSRGAEE